jgi:hypothetical protein
VEGGGPAPHPTSARVWLARPYAPLAGPMSSEVVFPTQHARALPPAHAPTGPAALQGRGRVTISLLPGGGAHGRRGARHGSCGWLPALVPASGTGAESQGVCAGGRDGRGAARLGTALTCSSLAQVVVTRQGTVAGYGMVALDSVQPGELLFAVPRAALLSPHTCSIGGLLERGEHFSDGAPARAHGVAPALLLTLCLPCCPERGALQSQSGWVPLLLALLHELQAPDSPWNPYFALWPELGRLEHPMFW